MNVLVYNFLNKDKEIKMREVLMKAQLPPELMIGDRSISLSG